jgi:hypothetical protein
MPEDQAVWQREEVSTPRGFLIAAGGGILRIYRKGYLCPRVT